MVVRQGHVRGYYRYHLAHDTPPLLEIAEGQTMGGDDYGARGLADDY